MGLITLLSYPFDGSFPTIPTDPGTLNTGTVQQVGGKLQYSVAPADNTDWYPPGSILMRGKLPYFSIPEMAKYRVIYAESEITSFTRNTPNSHANFMLWQDERNTAWIYTHASPTGTINAFRMVNGGWEGWGGPSVTHPVRVRMIWDRWARTVAYQYWTGSAWATIYTTQSFSGVEFTRVAWYLKSWEGGTCSATWDYILVQGEDLIKAWPGIEPSSDEPVKASVEEVLRFPQTAQGLTGRGVRLPGAAGSDIEDPSFGTQAAPTVSIEEQIRIDQRALYSIPTGDPQKNPSFDQTLASAEEQFRLWQDQITLGPNARLTGTDRGRILPPSASDEEEVYQEINEKTEIDFSPYVNDSDGRVTLGDIAVNHVVVYDTAGEQWATPSAGNGFHGAGRDGKFYVDGNEAGPTLNGTSFGTLIGGFNRKTWMIDVEPSAINSAVINPVLSLPSNDTIRFVGTAMVTGNVKAVSSQQRWCLTGDFDIQANFANYSGSGGSDGGLMFMAHLDRHPTNASIPTCFYVRRWGNTVSGRLDSNVHINGGTGNYVSITTSVTSGKMRLVRVGTTVTTYYDIGAGWVLLRSGITNAALGQPMWITFYMDGYGGKTSSGDFSAFTIASGTPNNLAGWAREAAGTTRGSQAAFPTKALIVSTVQGIDILDTSTSKLWMRFSRAASNALWSATIEPRRTMMRNGMMLVSYGNGGGGGTSCIDFTTDDIRLHAAAAETWTGSILRSYDGTYWAQVGMAGRDVSPAGIIASRNLAGGHSGDYNNWQIPTSTPRFTDIYEDGGYLYKIHATTAGIGVTKWRRWYNDGVVGSNWWSPIYFSSAVTTDMWWCWVDPSDGALYYMDRDDGIPGGVVGTVYRVDKATWTTVASGGTFAATASKIRPSNRAWTSFRGFHGATEAIVKGGYIYHAADEGVWRIDSALAGSWTLHVGSVGGTATLKLLPTDLFGVSSAQFCKDDSATVNLLLLECVLKNSQHQLYVINFDSGAVFARGSLRKGRDCSYLAGSVV